MIIVSGLLAFDPATEDATLAALTSLAQATAGEDGCLDYDYWASLTEKGVYRVFERWESEEAIHAHMAAPAMAEFLGSVGDLGITRAEVWRYDVSDVSKLM
jgi:quinol monooxygenase YgiN